MLIKPSSRRHSIVEAYDTYKDVEAKVIRKTKIRDLLKNPDYKKMSRIACHRQLPRFSKPDSEKICNCLNEKNGDMTVEELETATSNREETPGSMCVVLYDKLERKSKTRKNKNKKKRRGKSKRRDISSH